MNPRAQQTIDTYFPGDALPLATTDPELAEVFGNFAFDEAILANHIDQRTRLLTQLAALIAGQGRAQFELLLEAALNTGIAAVEIREVVYQAVPYTGMGKALDVLMAANAAFAARGIALPLPGCATTDPDTRAAHGFDVQAAIIGRDKAEKIKASMPADQAHIADFLSANCFGDHVSRGVLDLKTRELLTLSMLAALGGCDGQVKGHVAANLHVGNDRATLIELVTLLLPFIGYPRTLNALAAINEAAPA